MIGGKSTHGYFRSREVPGPQPHTYAIVAKQPNLNSQERFLSVQQRMVEESSKDDEQKMKQNMRDIINSKFHIRTDKKNVDAKIRTMVNERLQTIDDRLNCKRERLRKLLYEEDTSYMREYVTKAQQVSQSMLDEQKNKALNCKLKDQAEETALAAKKRLQQYMNRCEDLRTFREALNTKEVAKAVAKQIEDKKKLREADLEVEKMWHDIAQKNYSLMVAYEEEEEMKRKNKTKEMCDILQKQIKQQKLHEEEKERIKMEERANFDKLKIKMLEEEELAKRDKELQKHKMCEEMDEIRRQSKVLHDRRKAQEKVLDDMFCQLTQQEMDKEQGAHQNKRVQLQKERELYLAYLEELNVRRKRMEVETEVLRTKEMKKLDAEKHKEEVKRCEAALKLREDVLKERQSQIKAIEKQKEENKKKLKNEARLAELFRLETLEIEKEKKQSMDKFYKEYQMELAKQIEDNKQILIKQCEDEERQLREFAIKEETYFNKVKDIVANQCSWEIHPFMKKIQGLAI